MSLRINVRWEQMKVGVCSFCGKRKLVQKIPAFWRPMYSPHTHFCESCGRKN